MGDQAQEAKDRISKFRRFNIIAIDALGVADFVLSGLLKHGRFFRNTDLIISTHQGARQACALASEITGDPLGNCQVGELSKKLILVYQDDVAQSIEKQPSEQTVEQAIDVANNSMIIFTNMSLVGAAYAIEDGALLEQLHILSLGRTQTEDPAAVHFQSEMFFKDRYHRITVDDENFDFNPTFKWLDEHWK